jgi:redox-sensing transcriptional repressor
MKKISDSTISRLSKYYRTLQTLICKEVETISSEDIADIESITAAQVRKDLSFFGTFGKRGLGYNTKELKDSIAEILGLKKKWNVALVGVGNIGRALVNYDEFRDQGFNIIACFDNDPEKIGGRVGEITVHPEKNLCKILKGERIDIVIITVPANQAQMVVDQAVYCGVKAFLNFAPISLKAPEKVLIKNENMSIELEALSYHLTNR